MSYQPFNKGVSGLYIKDSKAPFHPDNLLENGLSLEEVAQRKGLDFQLAEAPALMMSKQNGALLAVPNRKIIYREDTQLPLSIVGTEYHTVQPTELLDTFDALMKTSGFQMRSAGSLLDGKRVWAMAETGEALTLPGDDQLKGFLFMAGSCDGSMATTGFFTSLRGTCWNMLQRMIGDAKSRRMFIKVPHSKEFNVAEVQAELGLSQGSWIQFSDEATILTQVKVKDVEAVEYLTKVLGKWDDTKDALENVTEQEGVKTIAKVMQLFKGEGAGSNLKSADGTAWGLVNAVTEFMDHHRGARTPDNRFNNTMLGDSFNKKSIAWDEALKLAA